MCDVGVLLMLVAAVRSFHCVSHM